MISAPSHTVHDIGDKVVIRDLELFVGFDPDFDDPDDGIKKYDRDGIDNVVQVTRRYISNGQYPKLILRHNPDDPDKGDRPVVGTILSVEAKKLGKGYAVVGDAEMTRDTFETLIASGAYPRRSAEIWKNGQLSEVALLGSETPARPLPDTRFSRDGERDVFTRDCSSERFAEPVGMSDAGPGNTYIPSDSRRTPMPDDTTLGVDQLKAKLKAMEDENKKLKAQVDDMTEKMKSMGDDKEKEKSQRDEQAEKFAQVEKHNQELTEKVDALNDSLLRERYSRKLDEMANQGYALGDNRDEILERIVTAADPDKEIEHYGKIVTKVPINTRVDLTDATVPDDGPDVEKHEKASTAARDRAVEAGEPEKFAQYLKEELEKLDAA